MRGASVLVAALSLPVLCGAGSPSEMPETEARGIAVVFGNTVKVDYRDGRFERIWFRRDGAWEALSVRGTWSGGRWSVRKDKICMRQSRPFPAPIRYCTRFPADGGVGAAWTATDWRGEPIMLSVIKGEERP